jgi:L-glutamine-phosphate cytidylyltransferase
MTAIILAAGLGSRLQPLTEHVPKCLLELRGKTLLERQLDLLDTCRIEKVTVVVGHNGQAIRNAVHGRVRFAEYPHFARTNNLHTLQYCGQLLATESVVLFADVLVEADALSRCILSDYDFALLVDTAGRRPDTMRIRLTGPLVTDVGAHVTVAECHGNFIGIAKFSSAGAIRLRRELDRMVEETDFERSYYTQSLPRLAAKGQSIGAVDVGASRWFEIDNFADYQRALAEDFYLNW